MHCIAPRDDFSFKLIEMGCHFHPVKLEAKGSNPIKDLLFGWRLSKILKKEKIDVLLSYTIKPNVYSGLFYPTHKVPIIANISGLGTTFIRKNLSSLAAQKLYKRSTRNFSTTFFQNQEDLELFEDLGLIKNGQGTRIKGSGIDLDKFKPKERSSDGPFTFLMPSRIIYDKGIREYFEAASLLKEKNSRFLLAGKIEDESSLGPKEKELDGLAIKSGVEYLGFYEDPKQAYSMADCIVLPSYREGLPKSLLEGAAMELPLITTDVPGCRDVVKNGVNGFLCSPMDGRDLAEKMTELMNLTKENIYQMGKEGRSLVAREFSKELVIKKYDQAIQSLNSNGN